MELVSIVQEVLQNGAERAASYRIGQNMLRHLDRALWTVEKCARWAVPPPLDQDERPQPELIRPLPWIFFFALLIVLRVIRDFLSLVNLALGKPPIRSADMVTYIQSKRRYLRTLKYQGSRAMRARGGPDSTYSSLRALLDFTMCFRRQTLGNNNTINNDEMMVVKRKRVSGEGEGAACTSENTMERVIEKMMVDIDDESDDSHSYTLTNVTSFRSDKSDCTDSEHEIAFNKGSKPSGTIEDDTENFSKQNNIATSTPEKNNHVSDIATKEFSTIKSELNSNNNTREATSMFLQHENNANKIETLTKSNVIANGQTTKTTATKESTCNADPKN